MMKKLEVILRTCDAQNVHNDWRVRYCDMPKRDLVLGCTKSLIKACQYANDDVKLTVLDDHSSEELVGKLNVLLEESGLTYEFIALEGKGYNNSAHKQYIRCRDSEYEFVYSVEDDYLHCETAIREMIDSFNLFTERLEGKDVVIYPFDAPEEYNPPKEKDFIVHGSSRHWRTGVFTTNVLFCRPKIFKEYWNLFEVLALKYNGNYLEPRTEHYEEANTIHRIWNNGSVIRFSPIQSLALHMQFKEQMDPFIDWKKWWETYAV